MIDPGSAEGRERLAAALGVRRWVDEVAAGGPYPSVDELVAAGDRAASHLTDAELDEAVGADPRADPLAGLERNDEGDDAAVARGAAVYEERFGREFLLAAAGRTQEEVLAELQRRLKNDDEAEAAESKEQLRRIAVLRLAALFGPDA